MGKRVKVIALVEEEQRRQLYHVLLDEGVSFADWLRKQIDAYLAGKEVKTVVPRRSDPGVSGPKTQRGGRHAQHNSKK